MSLFRKPEGISAEHWMRQEAAFAEERESVERHLRDAQQFVREELQRRAHILVFDLGGETNLAEVQDDQLQREVEELQFGGTHATHGEALRHMLGFEPGDSQVTIWEAFKNQELPNMPYPDVFLTTGGPAMPSELDPGNETENTAWLRKVVDVMAELKKNQVPGIAICLGHQLWNYMEGAQVGVTGGGVREYGTPEVYATGAGKDLQVLQGFWDDDDKVIVTAAHSEGVLAMPENRQDLQVIAWNKYMDVHGVASPTRVGQTVEEADQDDELVLTLQHHPEILARMLEVMRRLRGANMEAEGLDTKNMLFQNTPKARNVWLRFLELIQRRIEKRET